MWFLQQMAAVGCLYMICSISICMTPGTWLSLGCPIAFVMKDRCLTAKMSVGRKSFVNTNIAAPNLFVVFCLQKNNYYILYDISLVF